MTPQEFEYLRGFLKEKSGLVLSAEKQYLIESRLSPIVRARKMDSLSELITALRRPGERALQEEVVDAMTTNESFFFRDKTPFDLFEQVMLPELLQKRSNRSLRIWCAAASTGQEPYSLSISIKEQQAKLAGWRFDILGTDLSPSVLDKAKQGIYSQFEVQRGLPIQLLLKYFTQNGEVWQINPDIRSMVQWKKFNLLESFNTLGKFDIVFCRNVLIYFDQETKADILQRTAKIMAPDGYLVLGAAETVVGLTDVFQPVAGKRGLYQVNEAASGAVPFRPRVAASA